MKINIAIDGYAGCGKSTLAKQLAAHLNYTFVDTGALYRGVTYFLYKHLENGFDAERAEDLLSQNPIFRFELGTNHLLLNEQNVESEIRSAAIANKVSEVAGSAFVRQFLLKTQQDFLAQKGVVMEGRDIGTVIMPEAEAKFFITAKMEVRVERRFLQLQESGKSQSRAEVKENLSSRDHADATREEAPLKLAADAIVVDTSYLDREEQVKCLLSIVSSKISPEILPFV
jgi:cytidylate kinase